jgi:hypothetical protein
MAKRLSKKEVERRRKISEALKAYHRRRKAAEKAEERRRRKISESLKEYHRKKAAKKKATRKKTPKKKATRKKVAKKKVTRKKVTKKKVTRKKVAEKKVTRKKVARKKVTRKKASKKPPKPKIIPRGKRLMHKPPKRSETAIDRIQRSFQELAGKIEWPSKIYRAVNADGSVDGEIRVTVPRGVSPDAMVMKIGALLRGIAGSWITAGARFTPKDDIENYTRYMGLVDVHVHYRRINRKATTFVVLRDEILDGMAAKRWNKPLEVFVRLHWNAKGTRPPRTNK